MTYVFGNCELDTERAELRRDGRPVRLEPQVFDLVAMLVRSQGRVVDRDEIFREVWGDRIVSDAALSSRIKDARKAIGDDGKSQRLIRTVQRRGFRFVGEALETPAALSVEPPVAAHTVAPAEAGASPPSVFERPALAVLPFRTDPEDGEAEQLAEGLVDEVSAALSAWRYFPVVAQKSVESVQSRWESAGAIGRALGARYLVTGKLRVAGATVKIRVSLVDAETDLQLWSERIRSEMTDVFAFEEEMAARIATLLGPQMEGAEARRALRKDPAEMTAWELTMQASRIVDGADPRRLTEAADLAERAIERAPDWVAPYALVAVCRFQEAMNGFSAADSAQAFAPALRAARRALDVDSAAWMAHALTAVGELWTNRNHERALLHVARAIELNPSAAINYHFGGCITGFAGDPVQARIYQERLFRVDPVYRHRAVIEADLGLWHLLDGELDAAQARLDQSVAWNPKYGRAWQRRIALCGLQGDREGAQTAAARLRNLGLPLNLEVIVASYPFRDPAHRDLFMGGLRASGVNL